MAIWVTRDEISNVEWTANVQPEIFEQFLDIFLYVYSNFQYCLIFQNIL